jgi:hypothetical protein
MGLMSIFSLSYFHETSYIGFWFENSGQTRLPAALIAQDGYDNVYVQGGTRDLIMSYFGILFGI